MTERSPRNYPGRDLEAMSVADNYRRWIVGEFAPFVRGVVAEVGAGMGSISELLLASRIAQLHAFEPSDEMFPLLAELLAGDARAHPVHGLFGADQADASYDTIAYINVLEHVEDDRAEVANAVRALRPGGHLLVFVPALDWLYSDFDRSIGHVRRYTLDGVVELVRGAGLDVVSRRWFDFAGVLPWYVNFVLLGRDMSPGSVGLYDRVVVPIASRIEKLVPPPFGKNVLLVARRGPAGRPA